MPVHRLEYLAARLDLPDRFCPPMSILQVANDLRRRGDPKRIDLDPLALQHPGEFEEIAGLTARAGTNVRTV